LYGGHERCKDNTLLHEFAVQGRRTTCHGGETDRFRIIFINRKKRNPDNCDAAGHKRERIQKVDTLMLEDRKQYALAKGNR